MKNKIRKPFILGHFIYNNSNIRTLLLKNKFTGTYCVNPFAAEAVVIVVLSCSSFKQLYFVCESLRKTWSEEGRLILTISQPFLLSCRNDSRNIGSLCSRLIGIRCFDIPAAMISFHDNCFVLTYNESPLNSFRPHCLFKNKTYIWNNNV